QLLSAVAQLHDLGVVHRDIKPENLLVDSSVKPPLLKVCDLGTARKVDEDEGRGDKESLPNHCYSGLGVSAAGTGRRGDAFSLMTEYVGSRWYRAPEMLLGAQSYSRAVDVWACGCLMAELATGRPLFSGEREEDLALSITNVLGTLPPGLAAKLR
ncbi:unnamed protein product, partial [Discosporangium mesarthrocarpum]